jgi:BetI-type transcriptional repressor, C-terminal
LLLFGLRRLGEQFEARVGASLAARTREPDARERIELVLLATLPLDDDSRPLYLVYNQYFALALTDPALAALPYARDTESLEAWLADQLRGARGEVPPARPADDAVTLLALTAGLGNAVLAGQKSPADARRLLARHLDELFGRSPGAEASDDASADASNEASDEVDAGG